jgi:hypothetical protein
MDFMFPKPDIKKKHRSAFGEYLTEHQNEFVLISLLLGTYATIKVLLLQHDMDRRMNETETRSHNRGPSSNPPCNPDDEH